jgi:hypothetical protein
MRRVIVIGAHGFFGHVATLRLREAGLEPISASRHAAISELQVDADDPGSIRSVLHAGDIVLDAAGPFQTRTTALVEAATEIGFDVVDLSDSFAYAGRILAIRDQIDRSHARVLTSCSAVSAVSASLVRLSGIREPVRVSVFLVPASRATANPGTIRSFLASVGRSVTLQRDGRLVSRVGWRSSRPFSWPGRRNVRAFLTESADALLLPEVWPSLQDVNFWVDTQMPFVNALLHGCAQFPVSAALVRRLSGLGSAIARRRGALAGAFGVEVEGPSGSIVRRLLSGPTQSYMIAVAPAVLAVRALAAGWSRQTGLVQVDGQVDPDELVSYLAASGIGLHQSRDL